ncbi:MAG: J domain-containing protein, partial [Gammaproteobacteria bacterium]|nr:J domain-containing protein [Gammaproteobacteria bacterium]
LPANATYYEVLDVPNNATPDLIKAHYKILSLYTHPDKHPGQKAVAEPAFKRVTGANDILSDSELKRAYDQEEARRTRQSASTGDARGAAQSAAQRPQPEARRAPPTKEELAELIRQYFSFDAGLQRAKEHAESYLGWECKDQFKSELKPHIELIAKMDYLTTFAIEHGIEAKDFTEISSEFRKRILTTDGAEAISEAIKCLHKNIEEQRKLRPGHSAQYTDRNRSFPHENGLKLIEEALPLNAFNFLLSHGRHATYDDNHSQFYTVGLMIASLTSTKPGIPRESIEKMVEKIIAAKLSVEQNHEITQHFESVMLLMLSGKTAVDALSTTTGYGEERKNAEKIGRISGAIQLLINTGKITQEKASKLTPEQKEFLAHPKIYALVTDEHSQVTVRNVKEHAKLLP